MHFGKEKDADSQRHFTDQRNFADYQRHRRQVPAGKLGRGKSKMPLRNSGTKGKGKRKSPLCHNCRRPGHFARDCPQPKAHSVHMVAEDFDEDFEFDEWHDEAAMEKNRRE